MTASRFTNTSAREVGPVRAGLPVGGVNLNDIEQVRDYVERLRSQVADGLSFSKHLLAKAEQDLRRLESLNKEQPE